MRRTVLVAALLCAAAAVLCRPAAAQLAHFCLPCPVGQCPGTFFFHEDICAAIQQSWQPYPYNASLVGCQNMWNDHYCGELHALSDRLVCGGCTEDEAARTLATPLCQDDCVDFIERLSTCVSMPLSNATCLTAPYTTGPTCVPLGPQDCYEGPPVACELNLCPGAGVVLPSGSCGFFDTLDFSLPAGTNLSCSRAFESFICSAFRAVGDHLTCTGGTRTLEDESGGGQVCMSACVQAVQAASACSGHQLDPNIYCPPMLFTNLSQCLQPGPGAPCLANDPVQGTCVLCDLDACGTAIAPDQNTCGGWKVLVNNSHVSSVPPECQEVALSYECRQFEAYSAAALENDDCGRQVLRRECQASCIENAIELSQCWPNISAAQNHSNFARCTTLPVSACVQQVPSWISPAHPLPPSCQECRVGVCSVNPVVVSGTGVSCSAVTAFSRFIVDDLQLGTVQCLDLYETMMCGFMRSVSDANLNNSCASSNVAPKMCLEQCERMMTALIDCGAPIPARLAQSYCVQSSLVSIAPTCINNSYWSDNFDNGGDNGNGSIPGEVGVCVPCPIGTCPTSYHLPPEMCADFQALWAPYPLAANDTNHACGLLWDSYHCGVFQAVSDRLVCSGCTADDASNANDIEICGDECELFFSELSECAGTVFPPAPCTMSPYGHSPSCVMTGPQDCYLGQLEPCIVDQCPGAFMLPRRTCDAMNARSSAIPPGALAPACANPYNSYLCDTYRAYSDRLQCAGGIETAADRLELPCRSECVTAHSNLAACLNTTLSPLNIDRVCPPELYSMDDLNCLHAGPGRVCNVSGSIEEAGCVMCPAGVCGLSLTASQDECANIRDSQEALAEVPAECQSVAVMHECQYAMGLSAEGLDNLDCGRESKNEVCRDDCLQWVSAMQACWPQNFPSPPPTAARCAALPTQSCTRLYNISAAVAAQPPACELCYESTCRNGPFYAYSDQTCAQVKGAYHEFLLAELNLVLPIALRVHQGFICGFFGAISARNAHYNCGPGSPPAPQICLSDCHLLIDVLVAVGAPVVKASGYALCAASPLVTADNTTCIPNPNPDFGPNPFNGGDDDDDDDNGGDPTSIPVGVGECQHCPVGTCTKTFQFPPDVCGRLQASWTPYPATYGPSCRGLWDQYYCGLYEAASAKLVCDGCTADVAVQVQDPMCSAGWPAPPQPSPGWTYCDDERRHLYERLSICLNQTVTPPPACSSSFDTSPRCMESGPQRCYGGPSAACHVPACNRTIMLPPDVCQIMTARQSAFNLTAFSAACAAPFEDFLCKSTAVVADYMACTGNQYLGSEHMHICQSSCLAAVSALEQCANVNTSLAASCSDGFNGNELTCIHPNDNPQCETNDPVQSGCVVCEVPPCGQVLVASQDECATWKSEVTRQIYSVPPPCFATAVDFECRHVAKFALSALGLGNCGRSGKPDLCRSDCQARASALSQCWPGAAGPGTSASINATLQRECANTLPASCTGTEAASTVLPNGPSGCLPCYAGMCPNQPFFVPSNTRCSALKSTFTVFPYDLGASLPAFVDIVCGFFEGMTDLALKKNCTALSASDYLMCPEDCEAAMTELMANGAQITSAQATAYCKQSSIVSQVPGQCAKNLNIVVSEPSTGGGGGGGVSGGVIAAIVIVCLLLLGAGVWRFTRLQDRKSRAESGTMAPPLLSEFDGNDESPYHDLRS